LGDVTLAPIIGPVGIGKSACMHLILEQDEEFGRVQSFTTRSKRPEEPEDEYRFMPHDDTSLGQIAAAVRRGELVQYAPHPTTGFVYGSDLSDYRRPYMLLDTLASGVATIRPLPFKEIIEISMVAEPEDWQRRFRARNADPVDARKRILEGRSSIRWSLDQGDAMVWVCNREGRLAETADEIRGIVRGTRQPDARNRIIGERLLRALEEQ